MYTELRIPGKVLRILGEYAMKVINSKKKKNEVINKQTAEILQKFKNLLYF